MTLYRTVIVKGWWAILLALALGAFVFGPWVLKLKVHAGSSVLLGESDPDLAYYESTRTVWGYDEYAMICVTRDEWFDAEGIELIKALVADVEAVPNVDPIVSLLDVPLLRQEDGPAINPSAVKTLASEDLDYDRAREELLGHTQALGNLISANGRSITVLAYLRISEERRRMDAVWSELRGRRLTDPAAIEEMERLEPGMQAASEELGAQRIEMIAGIRDVARKWEDRLDEPVRLSGLAIINVNMLEHLEHDLRVFGIVSLALFTLAFVFVYRKPRFVVMPMVACLLPVVLVVGAMSWLEVKVTLITANLPLLLFTLMLPYAVYFIERYRERRAEHPDEPADRSTTEAAGRIWVPCLFSCLTTMAGFAALLTSDTRPVYDLGLFMVIGMGSGLVIVFLAIPSLSKPLPTMTVVSAGTKKRPNPLVRMFQSASLRAPWAVLAVSALLLGFSIWGASKISAQSKFTEYFRHDGEVYRGLEYIDQKMGGTTPLEVMLESDEPNFFVTQAGLAALEAVGRYFDDVPETGNVRSLATLVDELEKKNENIVPLLPLFARHPMVRGVTRAFANDDYSISRVLVRLRETAPTLDRGKILDGLRRHLASQPELEGLKVRETGIFLLYSNMLDSLLRTQKRTFLFVVLAIFLMLLILFRSIPLAFVVLLPQVLPALVTLGAMGWLGIPLDLVTVVIASIAMGVGIDAAIQYTFRFRTELAVDGDPRAALVRAHATIGRAIWIATSVIVVGFLILVLSEFRPSIWFGLFTAIAMLISQIAALTTLPSLFLVTGYPRAPKRTPASR